MVANHHVEYITHFLKELREGIVNFDNNKRIKFEQEFRDRAYTAYFYNEERVPNILVTKILMEQRNLLQKFTIDCQEVVYKNQYLNKFIK